MRRKRDAALILGHASTRDPILAQKIKTEKHLHSPYTPTSWLQVGKIYKIPTNLKAIWLQNHHKNSTSKDQSRSPQPDNKRDVYKLICQEGDRPFVELFDSFKIQASYTYFVLG